MALADQQLTELLQYCIGFGKEMIEKAGEFHPFGAEIGPLGGLQALGFWDGRENPPGAELYTYGLQVLGHKAENSEILGGAIAANANIPPEFKTGFQDAIRVQIETAGYARLIYLPYQMSRKLLGGQSVKYGEMFAVEIEPAIFRTPAS